MNKNDQNFIAQKIRTQYMEKESSELDALRKLDAQVKRPANIFAYTFGIAGSLIMGTGMSLAMKVIGKNMMVPGIIIGIIGILMVCINYPVYKHILASRKDQYANEIMRLSEKIINHQ
jgi:hypothetical protein